jgi:hypothetical protein
VRATCLILSKTEPPAAAAPFVAAAAAAARPLSVSMGNAIKALKLYLSKIDPSGERSKP